MPEAKIKPPQETEQFYLGARLWLARLGSPKPDGTVLSEREMSDRLGIGNRTAYLYERGFAKPTQATISRYEVQLGIAEGTLLRDSTPIRREDLNTERDTKETGREVSYVGEGIYSRPKNSTGASTHQDKVSDSIGTQDVLRETITERESIVPDQLIEWHAKRIIESLALPPGRRSTTTPQPDRSYVHVRFPARPEGQPIEASLCQWKGSLMNAVDITFGHKPVIALEIIEQGFILDRRVNTEGVISKAYELLGIYLSNEKHC